MLQIFFGIIKIDSNQSPVKAFLFFHQIKAEKCVVSVQLYRQTAYTE